MVSSSFPKLLDRYLFKQMLDYFLLGVVVFTLIAFFSDTLLKFIREVQKYGVAPGTLLTMIGLQLPHSISLILPASVFLAVLMTFNQLNNQFEIIALRVNGISLWRLAMPVLLLGLLVSSASYLLGDYLVPWCNIRTERLKESLMRSGTLPPNGNSFMYRSFDDNHNLVRLIYINHYHRRTLGDSTILDLASSKDGSGPGTMQVLQSRAGYWDPVAGWDLRNVNMYRVSNDLAHSSAGHFAQLRLSGLLNDSKAIEREEERRDLQAKGLETRSDQQSFAQLFSIIQRREVLGLRVATSTYLRLWDKLTYPLSCLVILLSAIPLAITPPRKNDRSSFVFSIGVLFLFYQLDSICNALGRFPLPVGIFLSRPLWLLILSWLPLLILVAFGTYLLQRKSRVL
jgi:lipopolysaccharide export system permease protein